MAKLLGKESLLPSLLFILSLLVLPFYPGSTLTYLLFSLSFNVLLYMGIRKDSLFYELFLSIFFYLGFLVKTVFRLSLPDFFLSDKTGHFNFSGSHYDKALVVASVAAIAFICAFLLRRLFIDKIKFFETESRLTNLESFYLSNKKIVWLLIFTLVFIVCGLNIYLGLYQRGLPPKTVLPMKLNSVFTWFLLFGFTCLISIFINFDIKHKKRADNWIIFLGIFETFLSNTSMLSRAMVMNVGSLFFGVLRSLKRLSLREWIVSSFTFIFLFLSSVYLTNQIRHKLFTVNYVPPAKTKTVKLDSKYKRLGHQVTSLIIDRWVGMEGVMAVSSSPKIGWSLLKEGWEEKYSDRGTSFYDLNLIKTPYNFLKGMDLHFISLPGLVAFLYYSGSLLFLFLSIVVIGLLSSVIEKLSYKISGKNLIFSAIIGQVIAYRYSNFGYCPSRSYILFGSIILTFILVRFLDYFTGFMVKEDIEEVSDEVISQS